MFGFKGETHADDFEGVGDEDAGDTRGGAADEAAEGRLVRGGGDEDGAELLVGEEFDGGVGEDAQQGGGVAPEEPAEAGLPVDVPHGGHDAEPGAGVFGELRVGGLEEDFDAVEGADDGFGLGRRVVSIEV